MKCPFCAEEIQDEAIVCRYCGAKRAQGLWQPPPLPRQPPLPPRNTAGQLTIQSAGWFFVISAVYEGLNLTSPVPLFGAMRDGFPAWLYHSIHTGFLLMLAIGYLRPYKWSPRLTLTYAAFVTLDRVVYLIDGAAREAEIHSNKVIRDFLGEDALQQMNLSSALLMVLSWCGLAAYIYYRRAYFDQPRN